VMSVCDNKLVSWNTENFGTCGKAFTSLAISKFSLNYCLYMCLVLKFDVCFPV